jgi:YVTN family beta-propeller protein
MKYPLNGLRRAASKAQSQRQVPPGNNRFLAKLLASALLTLACADGTPGQTSEPVAVAVAQDALELSDPAISLPIVLPNATDPLLAGLTIPADAPSKGMWSPTQSWPLNGLHSVLLPNGRVLTYGTPTGTPATQDGRYFDVWDPAQGFSTLSHRTSFRADQVNSFCSSAAFLADGRLLVAGGNSPLDSSEFTPSDGTIATALSRMADERWYGTMLALTDGRLLMLGGSTPYGGLRAYQDPLAAINAGTVSMTPELFEPGIGWRSLFGAQSRDAFGPDHHRYWYPRAWVAPNGEVFGISSEKLWYLAADGSGSIRVAGDFKTGVSATTRPNIGPTSAAVMFAPGRVLQLGGNGYYDGHGTPSSALATVIDINGNAPIVSETTPMGFARQWPSATVLPDGRVVVTGGTRYGNNGGADAVYEAELWNPATGTWTVGARAAQIRVYHSAAILMPNGAVLSTGGGAPGPVNNLNAELFYPPYLFRAKAGGGAELAPRPELTAVSALKANYGEELEVDLSRSDAVAKVVLIGASAVTHSFNTTQRRTELAFVQGANRLAIAMPTSANEAPPGYYVLFVLDTAGVPSSGLIIAVGSSTAPPPVQTVLPRGNRITLESVNLAGNAVGTDSGNLGILKPLSENPSQAELQSVEFWVRDGLADSGCVSLESVAVPGQWLRHQGYRLRLSPNDGADIFKNDATFCPEPGLSGTGVTLRSKNFPDSVLRHRGLELWIDPVATDAAFALDASFTLREKPRLLLGDIPAPPVLLGATASYSPATLEPGLLYVWDFGDGTAPTPLSSSPAASHLYAEAGIYLVSVTARAPDGVVSTKTFAQAVYPPPLAGKPRASSPLALEPRTSGAPRLWVVNPDNNSVSVFDTASGARLAETNVGTAPRSVGVAPDGRIWVVNRDSTSISILSASTLAVVSTVALPRASRPYGLVFAPDNQSAFVALEGSGRVLKLNAANAATLATLNVGPNPQKLSLSADGTRLLVSRFVTTPLPGEATATPQTTAGGGDVLVVQPSNMTLVTTVRLAHSDLADGPVEGRGIPNYLGAAVIAPDGASAWVPSKQDNIARGFLREGTQLDFQSTVRAVSSRISLGTLAEDREARIDHDDSGVAVAAAFHPTGAYLFVALETSREVAVVNALDKHELFRIDVGRAPQGVLVSADGTRLYVQNFMDRSVSVVDLTPLVGFGEFRAPITATLTSIGSERLSAQVKLGKQLFYDALDPRLARDAYLSCAACHADGGHDGRVWDLTGMGEGLRNTVSLRGRSGAQSLLHWTGNFDEVQDFEGQIRNLNLGTGLMSDADYFAGTRSQPLGDAKAGRSADLDALAAYVKSLGTSSPSPYRNSNGTLTSAAVSGRTTFGSAGCPSCHNGSTYSDEGLTALRNIGTLKPSSGSRLGAPLTGIDVPTLRDAWTSAPYLHDGSAPDLAAAVAAHNTATLTATQRANLAAFIQQIDATEPGFAPSGLTNCASENGTCRPPAGRVVTVYYGANSRYFSRMGVSGSIACNNATFGDPIPGTRKNCSYR